MLLTAVFHQPILPGLTGCLAEAADAIKKDDLLCQQVSDGNPEEPGNFALPVMTEEPVLVKKKKKAGFNVRKSLAWNNAFFTEEGGITSSISPGILYPKSLKKKRKLTNDFLFLSRST